MGDVVYYLRRNDLIKIGWTSNLRARMRALRPDELLAVEPGGMKVETGRHRQFTEHRLPNEGNGVEWFRPAPELLAHIDLIARTHPTPVLADLLAPRVASKLQAVIPPVPTEEIAAVRRVEALRGCDPSTMSDDELLAGMRDCVAVTEALPRWQGRIIMALRNQGHSWSAISAMTGDPQSTLHNRVNRSRAAEVLATDPEGVSA